MNCDVNRVTSQHSVFAFIFIQKGYSFNCFKIYVLPTLYNYPLWYFLCQNTRAKWCVVGHLKVIRGVHNIVLLWACRQLSEDDSANDFKKKKNVDTLSFLPECIFMTACEKMSWEWLTNKDRKKSWVVICYIIPVCFHMRASRHFKKGFLYEDTNLKHVEKFGVMTWALYEVCLSSTIKMIQISIKCVSSQFSFFAADQQFTAVCTVGRIILRKTLQDGLIFWIFHAFTCLLWQTKLCKNLCIYFLIDWANIDLLQNQHWSTFSRSSDGLPSLMTTPFKLLTCTYAIVSLQKYLTTPYFESIDLQL